jgi:hypothetical protein
MPVGKCIPIFLKINLISGIKYTRGNMKRFDSISAP